MPIRAAREAAKCLSGNLLCLIETLIRNESRGVDAVTECKGRKALE